MDENWIISSIEKRKLSFFGCSKQHSGLEKVIVEGMGHESEKKGGQGDGRDRISLLF